MNRKKHTLGSGQLTMIALGSIVGGSFFLGSSVAIRAAGPSVILAYIFCGLLAYYILFATSEMTVASPGASFQTFARNAFGEGAGFVVGWMYWIGMVLCLSSEATAVSLLLRDWFPRLPLPLTSVGVITLAVGVNLSGVSVFSRLESALSAVKLLAVVGFIVLALLLIFGALPGRAPVGLGAVAAEPFAPGGATGVLGSLLVVMFSYCGFEVISLAVDETENPRVTIPRAIRQTVAALVGLYLLYIFVLLPLIPTGSLSENVSPIVAALHRHGVSQVGDIVNAVLIIAIASTMLATAYGAGRMMRALSASGLAPRGLRGTGDNPFRSIGVTGLCGLAALGIGGLFPRAYVFLISASGFTILFTYAAIMASHIRFRRTHGCPPDGRCQLRGFPYTSIFTLTALIVAMFSMPFIEGQAAGLYVGLALVLLLIGCYGALTAFRQRGQAARLQPGPRPRMDTEIADELEALNPKKRRREGE